jgi:hypothetical protein
MRSVELLDSNKSPLFGLTEGILESCGQNQFWVSEQVRLGELIQVIGAEGPDNTEKLREFTHCKKRFSRNQDALFMSNDFVGEFC